MNIQSTLNPLTIKHRRLRSLKVSEVNHLLLTKLTQAMSIKLIKER